MQLTPRTLVMAIGACLAGGLVLGAVATFAPSLGSANRTPGASNYDEAELGDSQVSFPMPTATPPPAVVVPSAMSTSESLTPVPTSASAEPVTSTSPSPSSVAPKQSAAGVAEAMPEPSRNALPHSTPAPHRSTTALAAGRTVEHSRPAVPAAVPAPLNGWVPSKLRVGPNDVSVPQLSTGAKVAVTVMCSPSAACQMSGSSLVIDPTAAQVAITWRTPGNSRSKAWTASRTLSVPATS